MKSAEFCGEYDSILRIYRVQVNIYVYDIPFSVLCHVYMCVYSIVHCPSALIKYIPISCGALTDRVPTTFDCPRSCPIVAGETISLSREISWAGESCFDETAAI